MLKKLIGIFISLCSSALATAADPMIDTRNASIYVDEWVTACGTVVEVNHMPNRHYINFDRRYPNQSLTALVWNKDFVIFEKRFGRLDNYVGQKLCVVGNIIPTKYNLQMNVSGAQFIKIP
ncbi:hypothetical protein [Psychrobacter sp.]|uniref:hypothetical protein n=1 Tax=Psychrobacter sp. TaxID=56811 RepID=UPI0025E733D2|nr:hypothetical protein [Psychrobacter sp.]